MKLHKASTASQTALTVSGELLKKRASEGVRVCIMIWDDRSSINLPVLTGGSGLMITHDEETRRYFAGSKVGTAAADCSPAL